MEKQVFRQTKQTGHTEMHLKHADTDACNGSTTSIRKRQAMDGTTGGGRDRRWAGQQVVGGTTGDGRDNRRWAGQAVDWLWGHGEGAKLASTILAVSFKMKKNKQTAQLKCEFSGFEKYQIMNFICFQKVL